MRERILANFSIAAEAVMANRVRSFLTALGIIFGVAAVIAMMAIGNGAQQEILEQIKLVGVNNIVIEPVIEQSEEDITEGGEDGAGEGKPEFSPGLSMLDVESILSIVPGIDQMSPEVMVDTYVINNGLRRTSKLVGVTPAFFDVSNLPMAAGKMFNDDQQTRGLPVCIIGNGVKAKFFPQEDPVGKILKCGPHWLEVVGVLEERRVSQAAIDNLGIRDYNMDVYTPIKTMLIRFRNRAKITEDMLGGGGGGGGGRVIIIGGDNDDDASPDSKNYHQLDRLVIQVAQT
ncbi:MAG: ABC transporter permease, partial [Bacteroidota bacterium]